jgi:hypothetical protein
MIEHIAGPVLGLRAAAYQGRKRPKSDPSDDPRGSYHENLPNSLCSIAPPE